MVRVVPAYARSPVRAYACDSVISKFAILSGMVPVPVTGTIPGVLRRRQPFRLTGSSNLMRLSGVCGSRRLTESVRVHRLP